MERINIYSLVMIAEQTGRFGCFALMIFNIPGMFRAIALPALPSVIFLFCGIMSRYILLVIAAAVFASAHIVLSCKNAEGSQKEK